ncbi:MAG: pyridoxal phosphate-dependent aminotransferase [Dehalococcoidia bacterium]|nr:pyridoxal phosphate-dependent aminotransferase [Dehalococcoidia bacterium]
MDDANLDLLAWYTRYFQPGVVDVSASNPPPWPLPAPPEAEVVAAADYVAPMGAPALRGAIAARYATLSADDVILGNGASEVLAALGLMLARRGSRVAVDRGAYPSFLEAVRAVGGDVLPLAALGPGVAAALANNPTVPDGRLLDVPGLVAAARATGAVPVVDEVYRDFAVPRPPAAADCDPGAVSVGGLSKPLGLGGLRVGWAATRDRALLARLDRQLQLLAGGPSGPSLLLARVAVACFDEAVAVTRERASANAPALYARLAARGWTFAPPEAGLTLEAWPPHPLAPGGGARLLAAGLFAVPCSVYGTPGAWRFGLLADVEALDRALGALQGRG